MPTKTHKYKKESGLIKKISQHPTIRMIGLFSDLPISNSKKENKSSLTKKILISVIFIALGLFSSIYLFGFSKNNTENATTAIRPIEKVSQDSSLISTIQVSTVKASNLSNKPKENKNNIDPVAVEINKENQFNSQKINKLETLLLKEQRKNKELYQKLTSQDSQLKELLATAIKNIRVDDIDKNYVDAIIQKESKIITEQTKLKKIDYYNKVRVLLKGQQQNKISKNDHRQLQIIVNQLLNENNSNDTPKKESQYSQSLDKESAVRINEVRSIVLKKGETLWGLAERAYSDGNFYKKILKANPQITEENARFLQPGILIRIPK